MAYNPDRPARKRLRLNEYNYAQNGAYFVTICTQNRLCLFGDIMDGIMQLNDAGQMVEFWWNRLGNKYTNVEIDAFIVMPNHLHAILIIHDNLMKTKKQQGEHVGSPLQATPAVTAVGDDPCVVPGKRGVASLSTMIQWFKTMTTNAYIRGVRDSRWEAFPGKLWQRSFHDHIIRNETSCDAIREYILNNPTNWLQDDLYPTNR